MSATTSSVLSALRDVQGVLGSFLLDRDGRLLASDLPPLFDGAALHNASLHLARLRAALESAGTGFDSCVTRFGPHLLVLRAASDTSTLCVLCPQGTNLPAVQMSATLIARRLAQLALTPLDPASTTRERELDGAPAAPPRRFRGRSL